MSKFYREVEYAANKTLEGLPEFSHYQIDEAVPSGPRFVFDVDEIRKARYTVELTYSGWD